MRRGFNKGAAFVAAAAAATLAFAPMASAADNGNASDAYSGSGYADIYRTAGTDRQQTSLEALKAAEKGSSIFVVGRDGVVDALSLAPLTNCNPGYVVYTESNGKLAKRQLDAIKKVAPERIYIIGGTGVVSADVEGQIADAKLVTPYRLDGADRYETAYVVGAWAASQCGGDVHFTKTQLDEANRAIKAYEAAVAKQKVAEGNYTDAVAAHKAAQAKFAEALKNLEAAGNKLDAPSQEDLDKANSTLTAFAAFASAANPEVIKGWIASFEKYFVDTAGTFGLAAPGGNENATVQQYIDAYPDQTDFVASMKLLASKGFFNLDDTYAEALAWGKGQVGFFNTALNDRAYAAGEAAKAQVVVDQKAAVFAEGKAAAAAAFDAYNAASKNLDKALATLKAKASALQKAINDVKDLYSPAEEARILLPELKAAYAAALDAAYKNFSNPIFVSRGDIFPDALAAGPAAAKQNGVVLLTNNETLPAPTAKALALSKSATVGIGGPAVAALKADNSQSATTIVGKDRYETSVKVAQKYFLGEDNVWAVASGQTGADAVIASAFLASVDGGAGVLLTQKDNLPKSVESFIKYGNTAQGQKILTDGDEVVVFGGEGVIADTVVKDIHSALAY